MSRSVRTLRQMAFGAPLVRGHSLDRSVVAFINLWTVWKDVDDPAVSLPNQEWDGRNVTK